MFCMILEKSVRRQLLHWKTRRPTSVNNISIPPAFWWSPSAIWEVHSSLTSLVRPNLTKLICFLDVYNIIGGGEDLSSVLQMPC